MDVSRARAVAVPDRPIAFWMRLAHVHGLPGPSGATRAPMRVLSDFELTLQLDGLGWVWSELDQGSIDVPAGSISFIPPGFVHAGGSESGRHISVHFDLHARPELQLPDNQRYFQRTVERRPVAGAVPPFALHFAGRETPVVIPLVTALPNPARVREQLLRLVELWNRRATASLDASFEIARVLGAILRELALPVGHDRGDPRILALIRRLDEFLPRRVSVADLAASLGIAESTFREAFVRTVGLAPRRYLEEWRIEHAARALMETDWSVAEIASAVGYEDPYHFSRAFTRVTGASPRLFRTRVRGGEISTWSATGPPSVARE